MECVGIYGCLYYCTSKAAFSLGRTVSSCEGCCSLAVIFCSTARGPGRGCSCSPKSCMLTSGKLAGRASILQKTSEATEQLFLFSCHCILGQANQRLIFLVTKAARPALSFLLLLFPYDFIKEENISQPASFSITASFAL